MLQHTVVMLSAIYSASTTINLYQEMKRNEMKYVEKKISESAEYAYSVCRHEQTINKKIESNGYILIPLITWIFPTIFDVLRNKPTPPIASTYSQKQNNTDGTFGTVDNLMTIVAIDYFNDKYSKPAFYINSKLSDQNIHKLIDSELKLVVANNTPTKK